MELSLLDITDNRIKALNKKGFMSVEDIQSFFPRKYYDFSYISSLSPAHNDQYIAITGTLDGISKSKKNGLFMLKAKVFDNISGNKLNVIWMGGSYLYNIIQYWEGQKVIVCGKMTYSNDYHSFHMANPLVFDKDIEKNLKVMPIYTKMSKISEDFMRETVQKAIALCNQQENIPEEYIAKYHLMSRVESIKEMHNPSSMSSLQQAKKRLVYEKLYTFSSEIEREECSVSKGSQYNIKSLTNTNQFISSLPFTLTKSQKDVFEEMKKNAYEGRRVRALVQGDVGSGKTMSAFLMMFAMADSGYQSLIMAPTQILAKQHYEKLKEAALKYGYKVAFLSSENTLKEKKSLLTGIQSGEYTFIVGTHSVLNPDIVYKNLSLVVIDEEHRFGVVQREQLLNRAKDGVHTISMSATPIPRTMAGALFGSSITVYDLELPSARKPIQTAIFSNTNKIYEFIYKKILETKQQIYVVCPWIEDQTDSSDIATVEDTLSEYQEAFANTGVTIGVVTGKMKPQEVNHTIQSFSDGNIQILISTTVIEVGVNVPNANVIIINNAERFGLAQLHQLRGRVGRGSEQGYCILNSTEKENPRLLTMCKTTNGYEIAEEDMKIRGTGNILGTEQSGSNEYINLILQYPNMYQKAKEDAKKTFMLFAS